MTENGVGNDKKRSVTPSSDDAVSDVLPDAALDALLDAAPAPPASEALQRAILDDFDAVHASAPQAVTQSAGFLETVFGRFLDRVSAGAMRLASAGVLSAVAAAGFTIGILMNGAVAGEAVAEEQEIALAYFSTALSDTAFYDEGDALWRAE